MQPFTAREPGVDVGRRVVEPPARKRREPGGQPADGSVVVEPDRRRLEPVPPIDPHLVRTVHQDVGDLCVGEQRLEVDPAPVRSRVTAPTTSRTPRSPSTTPSACRAATTLAEVGGSPARTSRAETRSTRSALAITPLATGLAGRWRAPHGERGGRERAPGVGGRWSAVLELPSQVGLGQHRAGER